MKVKDIIASSYILLDNASEEELDYAIAVEQFGSVISMMRMERILADSNELIVKGQLTFPDTTGIVENTLLNFGDPVFLRFNDVTCDECSVNQLDLLDESGKQAVAFWTDAEDSTNYVELAQPATGILDVWYEPNTEHSLCQTDDVELNEYLRYAIVCRLAWHLSRYVHFKDPVKQANLPNLISGLYADAERWKTLYLDKVGRIGTGLPFQRLPFMAR